LPPPRIKKNADITVAFRSAQFPRDFRPELSGFPSDLEQAISREIFPTPTTRKITKQCSRVAGIAVSQIKVSRGNLEPESSGGFVSSLMAYPLVVRRPADRWRSSD
jgi:hypothetical protein